MSFSFPHTHLVERQEQIKLPKIIAIEVITIRNNCNNVTKIIEIEIIAI